MAALNDETSYRSITPSEIPATSDTIPDETMTIMVDLPSEPEIPKDGRRAWLVCLGAFVLQVLIVGVLHVWGLFFLHLINEFKASKSDVAWAGSAAYGISMALGPVAGILVKKNGAKWVTFAGCCICCVSLFLTSFINSLPQIYGSFSIIYGLGTSLAYTPTMTIAQDYFDKYSSVATGIMTAGSSTGTLILSPITNQLLSSIGWRNSLRVYAGTSLIAAAGTLLFKPLNKAHKPDNVPELPPPSLARNIIEELSIWNNRVFIIWSMALTFVMFGYYIPYVHMVAYAKDCGIPESKGSILMMVLGGSTAIGRVIFGKVVVFQCMDRLHMHQLSMMVTGAAVMFLPTVNTFEGILVYVIMVGLTDGCFVVLMPLMTATFVGNDRASTAWGFVTMACSITFTLGPPVAGWLYEAHGSYNIAFHVAGVPIIFGAITLLFIPWALRTSEKLSAISYTSLAALNDNIDEELLLRLSIAAVDMIDDPTKQSPGDDAPDPSGLASGKISTQAISSLNVQGETSTISPAARSFTRIDKSESYNQRLARYTQIVEQYKQIMSTRGPRSFGMDSSSLWSAHSASRRSSVKGPILSSRSFFGGKSTKASASLDHVSHKLKVTRGSSWLIGSCAVPKEPSLLTPSTLTAHISSLVASPNSSKIDSTGLYVYDATRDVTSGISISPSSSVDGNIVDPAAAEAANIRQTVDARMEANMQESLCKVTDGSKSSQSTNTSLSHQETIQEAEVTKQPIPTIVPDVDLTKIPNVDPTKVLALVLDYSSINDSSVVPVVDPEKLVGVDLSKVVALDLSAKLELSTSPSPESESAKNGEITEVANSGRQSTNSESDGPNGSSLDGNSDADRPQGILIVPIIPYQCPSPVELCTNTRKRTVRFKEASLPPIPELDESALIT